MVLDDAFRPSGIHETASCLRAVSLAQTELSVTIAALRRQLRRFDTDMRGLFPAAFEAYLDGTPNELNPMEYHSSAIIGSELELSYTPTEREIVEGGVPRRIWTNRGAARAFKLPLADISITPLLGETGIYGVSFSYIEHDTNHELEFRRATRLAHF